jgi:hypothetical protein
MSEDNQQGRRITADYLREEVLSHRWRGCALHSWMRKSYQKHNGIRDWPEEECRPPAPTVKELDYRRHLVEGVLALVDGSPDEETMKRLNGYMQGKFDDQLWFLLTHLADPKGNRQRPKPPRRTQQNDSSACL